MSTIPPSLIFGATGFCGTEVVSLLARSGAQVKVTFREQAELRSVIQYGVESVQADLMQPDSLSEAMDGIERVLLIVPISKNMLQMVKHAVDAAVSKNVSRFIYLSNYAATADSSSEILRNHHQAEEYIKNSGLNHVIVRTSPFFQNTYYVANSVIRYQAFSLPMGEVSLPFIDMSDVALVLAMATADENQPNTVHTLTGNANYSMPQLARILSRALGNSVKYTPVPSEKAAGFFRSTGLAEWDSKAIAEVYNVYASGDYSAKTDTFIRLTNKTPTSAEQFFYDNIESFTREHKTAALLNI